MALITTPSNYVRISVLTIKNRLGIFQRYVIEEIRVFWANIFYAMQMMMKLKRKISKNPLYTKSIKEKYINVFFTES